MLVRGAPLIGATAAYRDGTGDAVRIASDAALDQAASDAGGDAADRDQPEMGARSGALGLAAVGALGARRRGLCDAPARSPSRTSPSIRASASSGLA